ncbi:Superoxide dismutase [Mn] [Lamellibrachia satsuma]|nr:Superoxide dismutase [Mn] [Lamellibrachia satsuma]
MAATAVLALTVVYAFSTCLSIAPPYYLTTVKASFYILPLLDFNETDFVPLLSEETFTEHYYGIHQDYQERMHDTLKAWRQDNPRSQLAWSPVLNVLKKIDTVPDKYREKLKVEVGGFINHCIVWGVMSQNRLGQLREPTGKILRDIEREFISFDMFTDKFTDEAMKFVGSGYVWLVRQSFDADAPVEIMTTSGEDSPFSQGRMPLLVLDMWEHAYYQMHVWRREKYITNWWLLVDWNKVEEMEQFWLTGKLKSDMVKKQEL